MSEPTGDSAPRFLDKLRDMLPGMKRQRRMAGRRRHPSQKISYQKSPRQMCDICNSRFDYAIVSEDSRPQITRCEHCKSLLSEGYTAFITLSGGYVFGKFSALRPELRGRVRIISDDELERIKAAMDSRDRQKKIGTA